jgi:pantoate--beta-alanine ligase
MTTTTTPTIVRTAAALQQNTRSQHQQGKRVALVPTMGALHHGHGELLRVAKQHADHVVCSIFVNPAQFGPNEDLSRYPRTWDSDVELCARMGCDTVYAPTPEEVYRSGHATKILAGPIGAELEGAHRPGHFDGVLLVVMKLFQSALPDVALFGEKDFQQLSVIQQMVRDLDVPVTIVPVPIVRETDGLAMSSRNRYLNEDERARALRLSRALQAAHALFAKGTSDSEALVQAALRVLHEDPHAVIDYVEVRDAATLTPVSTIHAPARMLMTVRIGPVRLLDNIGLVPQR